VRNKFIELFSTDSVTKWVTPDTLKGMVQSDPRDDQSNYGVAVALIETVVILLEYFKCGGLHSFPAVENDARSTRQ